MNRTITKTIQVIILGLGLLFIPMVYSSCVDEEDPEPQEEEEVQTGRNYLASASYGDVVRFTLNEEDKTLTYHNETTGEKGSGSYKLTENTNISGVIEVTYDGVTYSAIELENNVLITSAPSGRTENRLCFGISSDVDLESDYTKADLSGRYLFVIYDSMTGDSIYGGYELFANGTFKYDFGPEEEADFNASKHFSGAGSGTWTISAQDKSRIIYREDGETYIGTVLPGKAMLLDNGEGAGFIVGLKYPSERVDQSEVGGEYRVIDVTVDGQSGIGTYTLPSQGSSMSYYMKYDGPSGVDQGSISTFAPVPNMNNAFKATVTDSDDTYTAYFVIFPGEALLHFTVSEKEGLISYGAGAQLP
jgi:hypothetical protein